MDDLIRRQEAIDAFDAQIWGTLNFPIAKDIRKAAQETIKKLPSAQPEKTLLTVKCEFDDEELRRAIETVKSAELELIAAQKEECKYWDNESHICALNRPSAQPEHLQTVMKKIKEKYEKGMNTPCINKPMAWALYETWKEYDK